MFRRELFLITGFLFFIPVFGQLPLARDTITVIENNYVLKMPWANGINFCNFSTVDLNNDGKKDIVVFDRQNHYSIGRFRCFLNKGAAGQIKYIPAPDLSYYFPEASSWAVFHDYNCDGKEDLLAWTGAGIKVYKNTSTASHPEFTLAKSLLRSNYNPGGNPSLSNIYASPVGVPGFADVDNDGDLDILTFSPQGIFVEYHKNVSKEKGWSCDSLVFELGDGCWGNFSESDCTVNFGACPEKASGSPKDPATKVYHAGSCLTCLDSDSDGDQDLIMGDVACSVVQYIHNGGTASNASFIDTTVLYPNFPQKNNTTKLKINNFPCTYYADVDNDGKKDLLASPNASGGENYKSIWLYRNASATGTVDFQFVKNNFLQDEMIEVGANSFPVLFDYNADGLKDLLIGTYGYYTNNSMSAKLTLYQNTGTATNPVYLLVSRDYGNLSAQGLNNVMPTAGDVDGDGDVDICMGTSSGQIHWLENTAGAGNTCNFSVFKNNPFSFTTISAAAAPQLFDLDGDGKKDLVIGMKNGSIAWYKNVGAVGSPSFSLITNTLGNVDVKGSVDYGYDGYAVPFFFHDGTEVKLMVGSVNGNIFYYSVPSANGPFTLISNAAGGYKEGSQSSVCYEDVNNDGKRDLFIGNASGGLSFFSSASSFVDVHEFSQTTALSSVHIFPNPAKETLSISLAENKFEDATVSIHDLTGRELIRIKLISISEEISLAGIQSGIYFVTVKLGMDNNHLRVCKKIVKE